MRLLWILLPLLSQGVFGALFKIQPRKELVVHQGADVTLECVTNEKIQQCAWKIEATGLPDGFLSSGIPPSLGITARDSESKTDCTIIISNIGDQHNGKYSCSPFTSAGQVDSTGSNVIIAKKPESLRYVGDAAGGYPLAASSGEPVTVQCRAEAARPQAEIVWYLGNTQLYENIEVTDTLSNSTGLWDSVSTLTHQFENEDNGLSLRCRANHVGYDQDDQGDQNQRETSVDVDVQYAAYRPDGNKVGTLYGFTAGQQGEVTINFTANPTPTVMSWRVGDTVKVAVGGQSLDQRFTAGNLIIKNASRGLYALQLTINPVQMEDQNTPFVLELENAVGASELEFMIGTGAAPPPSGMSGGLIGGIVAGVIVLVAIIALVVFGRSQGKWCFAGKGQDKPDKAARPRPLKARRPSASATSVNRAGGGGSRGGGDGPRRDSLPAGGRRSSRGAGGGKFGIPTSLAALKQSMSARPNRQRYDADDGSVESGLEEVTYVNQPSPAGAAEEDVEMAPVPQPLVAEGSPAPVEPPSEEKPSEPAPVDIVELEAPPRPIVSSAARAKEADLSAMPRTPPTPISPIRFPTTQPPAAVSSPIYSEADSPTSSLGTPQYPQPGQQRPSQMGPPGAPQMGPPGQQRLSQMGPTGVPQMGPPGQQRPSQMGPTGAPQMGPPGQQRPSQMGPTGAPQMGPPGQQRPSQMGPTGVPHMGSPGQQRPSQMGPTGLPQMGPTGQQRPSQMGPTGQQRPFQMGPTGQQRPSQMGPGQQIPSQMGPPGPSPMGTPGSQMGQSGPPHRGPRGSDVIDFRGSGPHGSDQSDRWDSGPTDSEVYSNAGQALPDRNPGPRWSQPAAGRQRGAFAVPSDSSRFPGSPSVDMPLAGSREELGIPYPPPGVVVRRQGPPLPPKSRPKSQVPAGAVRVFPGGMQSELSARFPSSPSLLDSVGSAV